MPLMRAFRRDVAATGVDSAARPAPVVTAESVAGLPPVARRYFAGTGTIGNPRVWSFQVRFEGRFRRSPEEPWMPCVAWQYNHADPVTRVFTMRVTFARVIPMIGHDTYVRGSGRMLGRVLGLLTVADGAGETYDIGELTTFLNDAVLLAPSMLLDLDVAWEPVDDRSFDVSLADAGRTVRARVYLDDEGRPADFSTRDRFVDLGDGERRCEWRTPVPSWTAGQGRMLPDPGGAAWQLPAGPFRYIEGGFDHDSIRYNVQPPTR